ncbi:MAG: glycoside hydrolase family 20 protein, partial [Bacteroidota bacterium]
MDNQYNIIPLPQEMDTEEGQFMLGESNSISFTGTNPEAKAVVDQFRVALSEITGLELSESDKEGSGGIHFQLDEAISHPEAYHLSVKPEGVVATAASSKGLFYAVQTLRQLLSTDVKGDKWYYPAVEIKDQPRFSYRGMHLDVARHFHPVETVKKMIDQLAYHKMNTFHWHLTDDQGWRIEIKQYPKLTEIGGFRNGTLIGHYNDQPHQFDSKRYGGFYTQKEIREVVQYAAERHVDVIPEIELPGHAQAAIAAYPELACEAGDYEVWQLWGVSDNVFCPTEETFAFLENVFDEVISLFPGKYIHIGGDECPKVKWKESAYCQQLMKKEGLADELGLQSYFIRRIEAYLNSKGKQIIGWDEILEGGLAPNATIMSWRGIEGGIEAAKAGHDVVMTPTGFCYLDYYQSDHPDEPLAIGGLIPLEKIYHYEPIPEELTAEEAQYILGAQVNLWTEYIPTAEKLAYMTFPRLSALSEVVWSGEERDFDGFVSRLIPHMERQQTMGVEAANHLYEIASDIAPADGQVNINLSTLAKNAKIHYTLDGSDPSVNSAVYDAPIAVSSSLQIKAQAFSDELAKGRGWQQEVNMHLAAGRAITLAADPHPKYSSGGIQAVINGIAGSNERYGDAEWLGFDGVDFDAIIDLGDTKTVFEVGFRFFKGEGQWIYLPKAVIVSVSDDGENYTETGKLTAVEGDTKVVSPKITFAAQAARYIKIQALNYGVIPDGKQGAG